MSPIKRKASWWSRWIGELANGAITALVAVAHRVGAPTLLGVPVSAAILTRVAAVRPEQPLDEVAQLFVAGRHDHLPVVEHGRPVSVLTRGDVAAGLERVGPRAPVAAAPSHHVVVATPSDSLAHVLELLHSNPEAIAVIVDREGPVGLVTADRLTAYLAALARRAA
jgi:CBS domain-containing protein